MCKRHDGYAPRYRPLRACAACTACLPASGAVHCCVSTPSAAPSCPRAALLRALEYMSKPRSPYPTQLSSHRNCPITSPVHLSPPPLRAPPPPPAPAGLPASLPSSAPSPGLRVLPPMVDVFWPWRTWLAWFVWLLLPSPPPQGFAALPMKLVAARPPCCEFELRIKPRCHP